MPTLLLLAAALLWVAAGVGGAVGSRNERTSLGLGFTGSLLGIGGSCWSLAAPGGVLSFTLWNGPARFEADALSAAFLLPLYAVAGLGWHFGNAYWPQEAPKGRQVRLFFGLLVGAMGVLFLARQALLFLIAWEAMAIAAFFLIGSEHEEPGVQRAAWVYLVCTHTGTIALTAMALLLAQRCGSLLWLPVPGPGKAGMDALILLLAIVGFGFKAGLFPFHFWLPAAHASAPSHVSALLSAVMLKAGIYGILRVSGLLPAALPIIGGLLLTLGAATALYGVAYALAQRDYKRLLAYSSIENIGIIAMGVGLGLTGRAAGDDWLAALGFGAALFHVWNHAAFKALLFFAAGSVLHATGTRDLEALGGLAARMPRTTLAVFPAVLAVAALPPLNAFFSEWILYRGLFASLSRGHSWSAGIGLPALALTGGLAAVAFGKFFGILFLGSPRSAAAAGAHDPPAPMLSSMVVLAGTCLVLGLGGVLLLPVLDRVIAVLIPGAHGLLQAGLSGDFWILSLSLAVLLALAFAFWKFARPAPVDTGNPEGISTWDCGYAAPSTRMQYTGSSFADGWASLLPGARMRFRRLKGIFPSALSLRSMVRDPVGEILVEPRVGLIAERLLRLRRLQPGYLSIYLLYVLLALLGVFLWMLVRTWLPG
jgi:hydrogenase-4 component B